MLVTWWIILVVGQWPIEGQWPTEQSCREAAIGKMNVMEKETLPKAWKCFRIDYYPSQNDYRGPADRELKN